MCVPVFVGACVCVREIDTEGVVQEQQEERWRERSVCLYLYVTRGQDCLGKLDVIC